ncbi:peptide/nickel transport system permease protein [Devosia lucknowensis]|uniref:Peptide/nickel transport system permease protein n=1 Tax=Devosia lucknowensis TaxID=1096929 RepID=A0A1Y6EGZ3_9HYPH|nr:ABC transporter permease [Devosia lucknowensis]SMQ60421.1 peptide/nickel transport system permease protein [Devosia lucknowensis]
MAHVTQVPSGSLLDRLDDEVVASFAPSQSALMKELGVKGRPGWTSRLPPSLAAFVTNPKGMIGVIVLLGLVLFSLLGPVFSEYNPQRRAGKPHVAPSYEHVLGTTRMGKDVYTQLAYGGRMSLAVGFGAGLAAAVIGLGVGISAGYFGGRTDDILTFFVNVVLVMPGLPLIIVIASLVDSAGPLVIGIVLALTGWGWPARTIRTQTLSLRTREFVLAAELMGESKWRIIFKEIFPNMLSFFMGGLVLGTIAAILAEAALSFIGLGDPNAVTWGTMLYWAQNNLALQTGAWWEIWPPAIAIMLTGAALVMINFAVDEITNPQLKASRRIGRIRKFLKRRGRSADVF